MSQSCHESPDAVDGHTLNSSDTSLSDVGVRTVLSIPSMSGTCLLPRSACRHDRGLCRCNYRIYFDTVIGGVIPGSLRLDVRGSWWSRGTFSHSAWRVSSVSHWARLRTSTSRSHLALWSQAQPQISPPSSLSLVLQEIHERLVGPRHMSFPANFSSDLRA